MSAYRTRPLIIDSFAGGGGASAGIEMALGRSPDIAINHNEAALAMHEANHPDTLHLSENIYKIDPLEYVRYRRVGLAWFSPDCKHFSKAKGGKPVERNIRDLAWVVVLWAERARPDVIILENVEEFRNWGPLIETGKGLMPDPERKGETFTRWQKTLQKLGYRIEWKELRACDYGAPTIRKRFFLVARRDGKPVTWPKPTHGAPDDPDVIAGRKLPWRTAAEIIDWSQPCPSIFDSSEAIKEKFGLRAVRPLAIKTLARIAYGMEKYVLGNCKPFLVNLTHGGRLENPDSPLATVTGAHRGEKAVVTPFITAVQHGGSVRSTQEPIHTIAASRKDQNAIIAAHMIEVGYGERTGQKPRTKDIEKPVGTLVSANKHALISAYITEFYGNGSALPETEPCHTISTHDRFAHTECSLTEPPLTAEQWQKARLVAAFLRDHGIWDEREFVTLTIDNVEYIMWDIGMRMLTPRELFNAQGFPQDYKIDIDLYGRTISRTTQISCCGNSVCPPLAKALVVANCSCLIEQREAAE